MHETDRLELDLAALEARWTALVARVAAPAAVTTVDAMRPARQFARLAAAYCQLGRVYHGLGHVVECLQGLDRFRGAAAAPDAVEFALWLHDAVYVPGAPDNEARSADLAVELLRELGVAEAWQETVRRLILATRHDGRAQTGDEQLVADIDLAILAAAAPRYVEYVRGIQAEYAHVGPAAYRAGRRAFLQKLLARPQLFGTPVGRAALEAAARDNIVRELEALGGRESGSRP